MHLYIAGTASQFSQNPSGAGVSGESTVAAAALSLAAARLTVAGVDAKELAGAAPRRGCAVAITTSSWLSFTTWAPVETIIAFSPLLLSGPHLSPSSSSLLSPVRSIAGPPPSRSAARFSGAAKFPRSLVRFFGLSGHLKRWYA